MLLVKLAALVAMGAILCSRQSAPPRRSYDDKVADLVASGAAQGFASIKKTTTGNRFEYHRVKGADAPSGARVDLSGFDGVIGVDADAPGGPVAHVEGLATMETVVAVLEPLGYRLPIVPELKHITVGGAISGVGIESGSFRHGWFHEALVSAEVLSPGGAILACGPDGEHADVFHALPNSYGTLGYVLRATLRLTPSKPVVAATTTVYGSFADAADAMRKAAASHEFVEGLWWAPDRVTVTVSDYAEQRGGETLRRFDGLDIYWKAVREAGTLRMAAETYYFRWDPDWFWNIPVDAGGWLVRYLVPRKLRTSSTYKWLRSLRIIKAWHRLETLWKPMGQPFVQDWAVPWSRAVDFVAEATKTLVHRPNVPYMLLPVGTGGNFATHYPTAKEDFYLNLGTYTEIDVSFADAMAETKRIDDLCLKKHGGIKMLYSSSFVDKATYDAVYGTLDPATRAKVDPKGTRPSVFEKTAHPSVLDAGADLVLGY